MQNGFGTRHIRTRRLWNLGDVGNIIQHRKMSPEILSKLSPRSLASSVSRMAPYFRPHLLLPRGGKFVSNINIFSYGNSYNGKRNGVLRNFPSGSSFSNSVYPRAQTNGRRKVAKDERKLSCLTNEEKEIVRKFEKKLDSCQKETTRELRKRLDFSTNILGIRHDLRNGSIKEGTVNALALEYKRKFPDELVLMQVGEFFETMGYDAILLVEYCNLNPMGGLSSGSVPRAGFPLRNLWQTLRDLNNCNMSACVIKEVGGPSKSSERKKRFLSGHSHPGSPYIHGLSLEESVGEALPFPAQPVPVTALARSSRGYTLLSAFQLTLMVQMEEGLTEEAALAKIRHNPPLRGFLHRSLKKDASGTARWGLHGEGGRLYGECVDREFEWYDGNPLEELLHKVRAIYDLKPDVQFRQMDSPPGDRPRPLYSSAACQVGIQETAGVPSLLKTLLPEDSSKLSEIYLKELLLNPPPLNVALAIQDACRGLLSTTAPLPAFHSEPGSKLVQLLRAREVNHLELRKIQHICAHVVHMSKQEQLRDVANNLLLPTWLATGIHMEPQSLFAECSLVYDEIDAVLELPESDSDVEEAMDGEESDSVAFSARSSSSSVSDCTLVPALAELYEEKERSWRGKVQRCHVEEAYRALDEAVQQLNKAVCDEFIPVLEWSRTRARSPTSSPASNRAEIVYNRDQEGVFLKGKSLKPSASERSLAEVPDEGNEGSGVVPGLAEALRVEVAMERGRGRKRVGDDWWTTPAVEQALDRYHEACQAAQDAVVEAMRQLAERLQQRMDAVITAANFCVIANALALHTEKACALGWTLPTLVDTGKAEATAETSLTLEGLVPYWLDPRDGTPGTNDSLVETLLSSDSLGRVVPNNLLLERGMSVLTGPNGGGKSSVLRSVFCAALLANCGLLLPAQTAIVPTFDAFFLRMMASDSPADGKSSFQMEMRELSTLIRESSPRSLVLVDELCRGTEVGKGSALVCAALEALRRTGCTGMLSTHLHAVLDIIPAQLQRWAMGAVRDTQGRVKPTWKLTQGECRESLAFEVALGEGVPESLVQRAQEIYSTEILASQKESPSLPAVSSSRGAAMAAGKSIDTLMGSQVPMELERITAHIEAIHRDVFGESQGTSGTEFRFTLVSPSQLPPPSATQHSSVYVIAFRNGSYYVGQTDNIIRRVKTHRLRPEAREAVFGYLPVTDKSAATLLETVLIRRLKQSGYRLMNKGDQHHKHFGGAHAAATRSAAGP